MARNHARLLTSIWRNDRFRQLDAGAQRLYMLLISQPDLSTCGVLAYNPKRWASMARDTTVAHIDTASGALVAFGFVAIDHDTDELGVMRFLHHDGVLTQPNILKSAARAYDAIHSSPIQQSVVAQLPPSIAGLWPAGVLATHPKTLGRLLREPFAEPFPEPFADSLPSSLLPEAIELPLGREEDEEDHFDLRLRAAVEIEVDRREAARSTPLSRGGRSTWRDKVRADVLANIGPQLEAEAVLDPNAEPVVLLARLYATAPLPVNEPDCELCGSDRWVELRGRSGLYPCPDCRPGQWSDPSQVDEARTLVISA